MVSAKRSGQVIDGGMICDYCADSKTEKEVSVEAPPTLPSGKKIVDVEKAMAYVREIISKDVTVGRDADGTPYVMIGTNKITEQGASDRFQSLWNLFQDEAPAE
jgi:hypothetical protein